MRQYDYVTEHLKKYRNAALRFTNQIRAELNQPPLEALLRGAISEATSCVVTKSIEAPGLYGSTGYDAVQIYDQQINDSEETCLIEKHRPKNEHIYLRGDSDAFDHELSDHINPIRVIPVPADVQRFLKAFDDGHYEDLVSQSAFEEV